MVTVAVGRGGSKRSVVAAGSGRTMTAGWTLEGDPPRHREQGLGQRLVAVAVGREGNKGPGGGGGLWQNDDYGMDTGGTSTSFGFCLGTLIPIFYKKHMRSCLASRLTVSGWGLLTHGARAPQPNGFRTLSQKGVPLNTGFRPSSSAPLF